MASTCLLASSCNSEQETRRDIYASKEDCAKDWGNDDCETTQISSSAHGFYGPHYYYSGGRPWYYPIGQDTPIETRPSQGAYRNSPESNSSHSLTTFHSSKPLRGGFGHFSSFHGGSSS